MTEFQRSGHQTLRLVVLPLLVVTVVAVVVSAVLGGSDGAAGAAIGGLLVVVFLNSSGSILEVTTKANPELALLVAMTLFTGKVAIMLVLLAVFLNVEAVSNQVNGRVLGLTLLVTSLTSTVLQILAYRRRRVLAYDLGNSD